MKRIPYISLILFLSIHQLYCSQIIIPDSSSGEILTPDVLLGLNPDNMRGNVSLTAPATACEELTNPTDVVDKIAIIGPDGCLPQIKAKHAINAGAIGVLLEQYRDTHGLLRFYQTEESPMYDISILEISADDVSQITELLDSGETVEIEMNINPNPIIVLGEGPWIFYTLFFALFDFGLIIIIGQKLIRFVIFKDISAMKTRMVIGLDLFACFLRIPILIDPTGTRKIYEFRIIEFFMTVDFAFAITSTFIIAFMWHDIYLKGMRLKAPRTKGYKGTIALAIIVASLLILLEIASDALRAMLLPSKPFLIGKVALYFLSGLIVGIYFFVTGRKIIKFLSNSQAKVHNRKRIKTISTSIIVCAVCLWLFMITVPLVPTPLYAKPGGYFILRFLASLWMYMVTATHIPLFKTSDHFTSKILSLITCGKISYEEQDFTSQSGSLRMSRTISAEDFQNATDDSTSDQASINLPETSKEDSKEDSGEVSE